MKIAKRVGHGYDKDCAIRLEIVDSSSWLLLMKYLVLSLSFSFCLAIAARPALAQLPTATGREFVLSDSAWKLFIPSTYEQRPGHVADVLVHFHGDPQTVWNNALYADLNTVIVTVNYSGLSSAYSTPFTDRSLFQSILNEALTTVRDQRDFSPSLEWDQLGVSSFSAGYGAVRQILQNPSYFNNIDALLAADSLYATTDTDGTAMDSQMVDYKNFASFAQAGSKTFLLSHSQVLTYTYENTIETGDELLDHLGISAEPLNSTGLGTLDFYRHAQTGNFQLWGALGADADAHLEHLRYMGEFLTEMPLARVPSWGGDFDGDGDSDGQDFVDWQRSNATVPWSGSLLTDWQASYGFPTVSTSTAVPEPSSYIFLLVCMGIGIGMRRLPNSAGTSL